MSDVIVKMRSAEELLPPDVRQALLKRAALVLVGRIKRRTLAGLDVDGKKFAAYSEQYGEARRGTGRGDDPNLAVSGAMLNSLGVVESTPDVCVIGFTGSASSQGFVQRAKAKATGEYTESKVGGMTVRRQRKLTHRVRSTGKEVSNALKAFWHHTGAGNNPERKFFGANAEDIAAMVREALLGVRIPK